MAKILKRAQKTLKNDVYNFPLRLKKTVAAKVIKRSQENRRSLNAQIEHELDK